MERIEKIKSFLEKSPKDAFLTHALALEWLKIGNKQEALLCFQQNATEHPDYVGTYYHLGKLLEELSNLEDAQAIYEKGIAVAKKENDAHAQRELQAALDDIF